MIEQITPTSLVDARLASAVVGAGLPTPEGVHRDGVDFVLVMLVSRENVREGVTQLEIDGTVRTSFTLSDPMEAVLLDDRRIKHEVTPIVAFDPSEAAHRDVLVVTFVAHCDLSSPVPPIK